MQCHIQERGSCLSFTAVQGTCSWLAGSSVPHVHSETWVHSLFILVSLLFPGALLLKGLVLENTGSLPQHIHQCTTPFNKDLSLH